MTDVGFIPALLTSTRTFQVRRLRIPSQRSDDRCQMTDRLDVLTSDLCSLVTVDPG